MDCGIPRPLVAPSFIAGWSHFAKTLLQDGLFVFDQDCGALPPLPGLSSCTVHEWRPSKQGSGLDAGPLFILEGRV